MVDFEQVQSFVEFAFPALSNLLKILQDTTLTAFHYILVNNLTNLFIMDKGWTEANNTTKVQDFESGEETYSVRNANGTGPYKLVSREPDAKTVLEIYDGYWGKGQFPLEVTKVVYAPFQNAATRLAALLSGEVDFLQDLPVQDLSRVAGKSN